MPQPNFLKGTTGRLIARFGGSALPNGQSPLRAAMLADVPVALWRCAEAAGATVLADEMGAFPGSFVEPVLKGQPGLLPDQDTSFLFNGLVVTSGGGYAQIPFSASLNPAAFSVVLSMMAPQAPAVASALYDSMNSGATQGFRVQLDTALRPVGRVVATSLTGTALTAGVPHIIHFTYDGANARLYQDGVLTAGPTPVALVANAGTASRIGGDVNVLRATNAYVQLVGIYNSALSQARATAHAAALLGLVADLNDGVNTRLLTGFTTDDDTVQNQLEQFLYLARGAWVSKDFGGRKLALPVAYLEDNTHQVGALLAALSQADEQELTFDGLTFIPVRYDGESGRQAIRPMLPVGWRLGLQMLSRSSWWFDYALTAPAAVTIVTDAGQAFSVTYAGSVFAEPVWLIIVPSTNAVALNSLQIVSTMYGQGDARNEGVTVNFLSNAAIPASTARIIRVDAAAMTAVDNLGNAYDVVGTIPRLYPPAGQVNPFKVIVTPASGASSGLQLSCQYVNRWQA